MIYSRPSFDPELLLRLFAEERVSFASLVPTHYIMTLGLSPATLARYDVSGVRRLLISSAPARLDIKQAILDHFRSTGLFEAYGSTEGGWVTLLRPEEQFDKLGSIGRECPGTNAIRLLDEDGAPVPPGEVGELYFDTPATFQGYWNLPEKTAAAFRDGWCTVGDMARRDADGYYHLADRRANLIISGGENVYPSEVENVLGAHPAIKDVAVVGLADPVWGETVHAVVVLHAGARLDGDELLAFAAARMAGYKRPRSVVLHRRGRDAAHGHRQDHAPRAARTARRAGPASGRARRAPGPGRARRRSRPWRGRCSPCSGRAGRGGRRGRPRAAGTGRS